MSYVTHCAICSKELKLDRPVYRTKIKPTYYGIEPAYESNLSVCCYKHPVIELPCFSKETIAKMREIKASGEKAHLIQWKDSGIDYVKIAE